MNLKLHLLSLGTVLTTASCLYVPITKDLIKVNPITSEFLSKKEFATFIEKEAKIITKTVPDYMTMTVGSFIDYIKWHANTNVLIESIKQFVPYYSGQNVFRQFFVFNVKFSLDGKYLGQDFSHEFVV